jgi:hypothetical protein
MIEELLPGLMHWSAHHDGIGATVYSCYVLESGTLIDPMLPDGGVEAIAQFGEPRRIVLSNRHHYRASEQFAERYGCAVLCQRDGLHEFDSGETVEGFDFGDELALDVQALELGSICPDETTLLIAAGGGVLSFADGLTLADDGSVAFMPDSLLGDDPRGVKDGLRSNLRRMLELEFDALRFAHAEPVRSGGRSLLEDFLDG